MTAKLTPEEKERFLSIWSERMPEVLTWSDDEILAGLFFGM